MPLESTLDNGDVVEVFTSKSPTAGPVARLAGLREVAARPLQDPAVVHQGAARGGDRAGQGPDRQADAQGGAAAQAAALPRVADAGRRATSSSPTSPRSTPRSARATSARRPSYAGSSTCTAATRAPPEDLAEARHDHRPARPVQGRSRRRRRRRSSRARPTCGSSSPSAARRCRPTTILGFVTKGGGVSVHRQDCTNAGEPAAASPSGCSRSSGRRPAQSTFLVNIQVEALDRARLLSDITMALSDAHVNILSANLTTTRDRVAKSRFTFEMAEAKHLDTVLKAVRSRPRRLRRLPRHPVTAIGRCRRRWRRRCSTHRVGTFGRSRAGAARHASRRRRDLRGRDSARQPEKSARGALGHLEERLAGGEVVLELARPSCRCRRRGPSRGRPRPVGDGGLELGDHVVGAGGLLGVGCAATARPRRRGSPARPCGSGPRAPSSGRAGTLPAASQRSAMSRKARLAASRSVTGSSASASTSSSSLTSALAANSCVQLGVGGVAGAEEGVLRAAEPLPQLRRRRRAAPGRRPSTGASGRGSGPAVGPQSVESASASASLASRSLTDPGAPRASRAARRSAPCGAGCTSSARSRTGATARRRRPGRCGGAPSTRRAGRAAGWRRCASRCRSASFSASATMPSLAVLGLRGALRPLGLARLALARRCTGPRASSRPTSDGEVADGVGLGRPGARTVLTDSAASSGDSTPDLTRCSSSSTSNASAS